MYAPRPSAQTQRRFPLFQQHHQLVHEALEQLAEAHPQKAELVKLRSFVGLTFDEASAALGIAVPTAKQWWAYGPALRMNRR